MAFRKSIEKLDDYYKRLEGKKTSRIKADHVDKVLDKLRRKETSLLEDMQDATKAEKRDRIAAKLDVLREQIGRAEWLLSEIGKTD